MAARSVVVNVSPDDKEKLHELAREAARQLGFYSSQRSVFLIYGQEIKSAATASMECNALSKRRGAVWVGNYRGPVVSVARLGEDLEAAFVAWYGDERG